MWKVHNDDRRKVMKIAHMTLLVRWAINIWYRTLRFKYYYSTSKILKKKKKKNILKEKKQLHEKLILIIKKNPIYNSKNCSKV